MVVELKVSEEGICVSRGCPSQTAASKERRNIKMVGFDLLIDSPNNLIKINALNSIYPSLDDTISLAYGIHDYSLPDRIPLTLDKVIRPWIELQATAWITCTT